MAFVQNMLLAISSGLTSAWLEGTSAMGVDQEELNSDEMAELQAQIDNETQYINGLADAIDRLNQSGANLDAIGRRLDLWGDAYIRAFEQAKTTAGKDEKLMWTMHKGEHCPDCVALDGKVKRASYWYGKGLYPKSWDLACHQGCNCTLELTDQPISKGPLGGGF